MQCNCDWNVRLLQAVSFLAMACHDVEKVSEALAVWVAKRLQELREGDRKVKWITKADVETVTMELEA